MKLRINGETVELENGTTLSAFLQAKSIPSATVVVEHNGTIPDRGTWDTIVLADGDILEIVKFMGGGGHSPR